MATRIMSPGPVRGENVLRCVDFVFFDSEIVVQDVPEGNLGTGCSLGK